MRAMVSPSQHARAAVLWWAAAAAFFVAALGTPHRPMVWVVAALFVLNGAMAMHRANQVPGA